jgi:hypothetical protein
MDVGAAFVTDTESSILMHVDGRVKVQRVWGGVAEE